ncbi:RNA polymerase II holoenzyme cyclin-like subunit [Coemansia guatemalensis]|uniref:RNA polymerase II holoenzyme cyclin-like subunit n=1 Tax=Coemansia guatemalensis TaxID=2761395 RepID=A0A9W8HZT9_9FUNG|nr:RNA polymerase II holoenzyme cyclin-like subunit [Coemansia guatemalensis]
MEEEPQMILSIINGTYLTNLISIYPPHVIAVATTLLSRVIDQGHQSDTEAQQWYADLNVEITDVLQVVNDMLALYEYWNDYAEPKMPDAVSKYIADIAASV